MKKKLGVWVIVPKSKFDAATYDHIKCSECGREPLADYPFPYCPWCGKKMSMYQTMAETVVEKEIEQ